MNEILNDSTFQVIISFLVAREGLVPMIIFQILHCSVAESHRRCSKKVHRTSRRHPDVQNEDSTYSTTPPTKFNHYSSSQSSVTPFLYSLVLLRFFCLNNGTQCDLQYCNASSSLAFDKDLQNDACSSSGILWDIFIQTCVCSCVVAPTRGTPSPSLLSL